MNISEEISRIINPGGSGPVSLTQENQDFIKAYNEGLSKLPPEDASALVFRNVISREGRCGFAGGGHIDYLINTDIGRRYRVTVRIVWQQGVNTGEYQQSYISEAGGKLALGCTDSGSIPVTYYRRQVVGETPI